MSDDDQQRSTWWGQYSLDVNQIALWEIGPLMLAIQRQIDEWQIASESASEIDPDTTSRQFQPAAPDIDALDYTNTARYAGGETTEAVWLRPLLADRVLVS